MRPVKEMLLEQPAQKPFLAEYWNYALMGALALATIFLSLYPPPIKAFAARSFHSISLSASVSGLRAA